MSIKMCVWRGRHAHPRSSSVIDTAMTPDWIECRGRKIRRFPPREVDDTLRGGGVRFRLQSHAEYHVDGRRGTTRMAVDVTVEDPADGRQTLYFLRYLATEAVRQRFCGLNATTGDSPEERSVRMALFDEKDPMVSGDQALRSEPKLLSTSIVSRPLRDGLPGAVMFQYLKREHLQ